MRINIIKNHIRYPAICWLLMLFRRDIIIAFSLLGIPESVTMALLVSLCTALFFTLDFLLFGVRVKSGTFMLIGVGVLYFISILHNWNEEARLLVYNYLLYCFLTGVFCAGIQSAQFAVTAYARFSALMFLICGLLPLLGSRISYHNLLYFSSGMAYGESVAVPCFIGLYVLLWHEKKLWAAVLLVADLAMMLAISNRSALLSAAFFVLLYELWVQKRGRKKRLRILALTLVSVLILTNLSSILRFVANIIKAYNIRSYSVNKLVKMIESEGVISDAFMSGRMELTEKALSYFRQKPLFGIGIGMFETLTGFPYTHNLFTDVLSTFGLIGAVIFFPLILWAVLKIFGLRQTEDKLFVSILLSLWFPRLLFSKTFVDDVPFWCFMSYALSVHVPNMNHAGKKVYQKTLEDLHRGMLGSIITWKRKENGRYEPSV